MPHPEQQRLIAILSNPSETPKIECKSWLDLSDKRNKATLAKAAIALANHGGGTIVLGVSEDETQGGKLVCLPKPAGLQSYSSDDIDSAINTYSNPSIDFELILENHPDTNAEHVFVLIPDGMTQPVFAKKGYNGVIEKYACYVRKPGPKSEVPNTSQEWRDLLNRCVLANRESMIDAIRTIVDGRVVAEVPRKSDEELHGAFIGESRERRQELNDPFPNDDPARLANGYFEIAFSVLGLDDVLGLNDLKNVMSETSDRCSSIWYLFDDKHYRSRPMGNSIETLYADPSDRPHDLHAYYYWRVRNDGKFYLIRGYQEDAANKSTEFIYNLPIWRIGQSLDYAANVCRLLGEDLEVLYSACYTGLRGRKLTGGYPGSEMWLDLRDYVCTSEEIALETKQFLPQDVEDNLVEILHDLLRPLYEQFSFYELRRDFVAKEVQEMRRHGR